MIWNYAYTSYIWPSVFTVLLLIALAVYSWHRRSVPGALPFMIGCLFAALLLWWLERALCMGADMPKGDPRLEEGLRFAL